MSNVEEKSIDDIDELVETDNNDLKDFFNTVFFDTEVEQEAPEKDLDDGEDEDNEKIVKSIDNLIDKSSLIVKGADTNGSMISINIIDSVAKKLAINDGKPEDRLHITLIYFKDDEVVNKNYKLIQDMLDKLCDKTKPFIINIKDTTIFPKNTETGESPLVAEVIKSKELMEFRKELASELDKNNIEYSKDFPDYTPHITLKYLKSIENAPEKDIDYTMLIDKIEFNVGDNTEEFELENNKIQKRLEVKAPEEKKKEGKSIFLAGSIDMGAAEDWQDKLANELKDYDVTLYNPRREHFGGIIKRLNNGKYGLFKDD